MFKNYLLTGTEGRTSRFVWRSDGSKSWLRGCHALLLLGLVTLFASPTIAQTYLSENFESSFSGSPASPTGWSQSTIHTVAQPTNLRFWSRNSWSGSVWSSVTGSVQAPAPASGSGVLWLDATNMGGSTTIYMSQRIITPTVNLSGALSPAVRFNFFWSAASNAPNLKLLASNDGGTTWEKIGLIVPGFNNGVSGWQQMNIPIPAAYRVSSARFAFEHTNNNSGNNPFIDDFAIQEWNTSGGNSFDASLGNNNWESTAAWNNGVVPTADNDVVIPAGVTVTIGTLTNLAPRCRNLTINGTLNFGGTAANLLWVYGNVIINNGGVLNLHNLNTSGRLLMLGGNLSLNNGGTINFSSSTTAFSSASTITTGAGGLFLIGGEAQTLSFDGIVNSGTVTSTNRIPNLVVNNFAGASFSGSAMTVTSAVGLLDGALNPTNLTIGNNSITNSVNITVVNGSFSSAPTIAALTGNRNWAFNDNFHVIWRPTRVLNVSTGNYFQSGSILGNLNMNTFAQLSASSDITLGNGSLSVSLTLTRGIINMNSNSFIYTTNVTGVAATLPTHDLSTAGPTFTYGSYIVGGIRVNYPTGSAATRTIPLGINTNNSSPSAQTNRAFTLVQTVPTGDASGQVVLYTVEGAPTDNPVAPISRVFGARAFRTQMISGNFVNASTTLQLAGGNFVGNSDNFNLGSIADLRVVQATSLAGPWTNRSTTLGSGLFVNNANLTRTTATAAPGPITPISTNGEYFAWGTETSPNVNINSASGVTITQFYGSTSNSANRIVPGATGVLVNQISVTAGGNQGTLALSNLVVEPIATTPSHITAAYLYRTAVSTFVNPQLVATVNDPTAGGTLTSFSFTGLNQVLTANSTPDFFWLVYDVSASAANGNTFDANFPAGALSFTTSGSAVAPSTLPSAATNPTGVVTVSTTGGVLAYSVTRNTGVTYTALDPSTDSYSNTTLTPLWAGTSLDDNLTASISFPFPFTYAGQTVTNYRISTNGWISLNPTITSNALTNNFGAIGTSHNTLIAPFWDDLQAKLSAVDLRDICTKVTGTAGSRVLTVQWTNWRRFAAPTADLNFQVKFYEGSNNIELVYGSMTQMDGTANTQYSYTVGLSNWTTTANGLGVGSVLVQQQANTDKFSHANYNDVSSSSAPNSLVQAPECNTSILFTAGGTLGLGSNRPSITNDEPATAITLPVDPNFPIANCASYRNFGATGSVGIPSCNTIATGVADDDVWFKFDLTTVNPTTAISVIPSFGLDAVVMLYSGTPGSLTNIACVNGATAGLAENISLASLPIGTYFIRVYHAGNGSTSNTLQVESDFIITVVSPPVPTNDNCSGAQTLTLGAPAITFTNVSGATLSTNIPNCGATTPGNADDDVWFVVQGSGGTDSVIVTGNQLYDPVIQVYSGDCNNLNSISCVNTVAPGGTERIAYQAVSGRNYFIRVYHQGSGTNANGFNIRVVNSRACATTPIPGSVIGPDTYQLGDPGMTFNLTGNNTTATSVQWQTRISTTSTWTNLSSGSASLTNFSPTVVGTHFVRAFSTTGGNCVSDTTAPVSVEVICTPISPVAGTVGSASANYFISDVGTFNLTGNTGNVIQWQISVVGASGPYSNIGGATTSTLNYTFNVAGDYWIRAQVNTTTSNCMTPVFTAPFTANVICATTNPVAGTISGPSTVVINTNNTYTTSGQTGTLFNWQSGPSITGPWTNISGGNTASLTYNASTVGTVFLRYEIRTTTNICQTPATSTPIQVDAVLPQPPVADFTANSTTATTGGNVSTVTFTDASTNNPTSWAWTFTPNTVTFVNGTSASSQNPQVQFNAVGNYTVSLIATNAGGSSTAFTRNNYISVINGYCAVTHSGSISDMLTAVTLGSINYTKTTFLGNGTNLISPAVNTTTDLAASGSYVLSVTSTTSSIISVWIDYNQNGVFEASEWNQVATSSVANTPSSVSITVPFGATTGQTMMRIRSRGTGNTNGSGDACTSFGSGENLDFVINILPVPPCNTPPVAGTLSGPSTIFLTQSGSYTVSGSNTTSRTWQSSTTGLAGSWVNIAGITGTTESLVPNVVGTIYLRVFGSNIGCTADTSNVLTISVQNVPELSYTVTRQTGITYNSIISGGNNFSWPGTSTDDQMSNALDVSGLNFVYQGIPVTSLRVNTNGFLTFLGTNTSSFTNIMTSTSALAQLSPYWDDLVVGNNSGGLTQLNASIKYLITGVSPNQVMTIEWSDMGRFNNTNLNFAFQVKLYEGSNRIEFVYGNNVPYDGVGNFDPTYSVGISSRVTSSTNYFISQAFENTANFTTGSTTGAAQDALAIPPTCNSMIRFQPSVSMSLPTDAAATVSNNEPASAELLTVPLGSYSDNCDVRVMRGATLNGSLTLPACAPSAFTAQNDVWYTFTTTGGGQHTINLTPNGGYDIAFQLLRGSISSLVNDTCVNAGAVSVRETLTRTLLPNTTYYLRVVSNNVPTSSVGAFSIAVFRVATPPANDNCSGAITLAANTPVVSGNTGDATASTGFTSCGIGNANDDVWYSFTATGTFSTISVVPGVGFNPVVQVLTGSCGTQTSVSCTNSTGINGTETVNITTVPGTTYFVRVYDFAASTPATGFTITLSTPVPACPTMATPGNGSSTVNSANDVVFTWNSVTGGTITYTLQVSDDPSFATLLVDSSGLTGLTATVVAPRFAESTTYFWRVLAVNSNGSSTGCTANSFSTIGTVPSCITSSTPANGATNQATNVTLSWTAGGGAPTGYDVFFGLPGALTLVSSNQAGTSYATSGLSNNTIYSWRIVPKNANGDAVGCQARSFTTVPAAPSNDECINAVSMTVNGAALISQSSAFATQSQSPCTGAQANDVWYSFVANGANQNISVVGAGGLNAIVQLFSGSCGSLSSISCVNNTGNNGSESINATGLTPGQTYFVRVYNANSGLSSGTSFSIEVTNQIVWNGSAWVGGTPGPSTAGTNITINAGSAAVLPNGTELNNLYVMNGGSVSLGTGTVTINGNITFSGSGIQTFGGTGTLVFGGTGTQFINGGASVLFNGIVRISTGSTLSTSSLILGDGGVLMHGTGTAGGGGNFTGSLRQRRAGSTSNLRYNLWSSPMSGSTLSNLLGNDLYSFNRTTQSWSAETPATVMQVGVGYSATGNINGFGGAGIRQFSGTPNNGDVNVPMSVNPGLNDDWNLVGNPYPSAINGLTFISNNSDNIVGPLYFWNTSFSTISANNNFTGADYATRSLASGPFHIGVAQGFFVEATSTLLEFTNSQRSTTNNVFLRNSSPVQRVTLLAHNAQNVANSTLIAFTSDATDNYDRLWDARKYKGNPTVSLYSKVGSMDAAINAMGELSTNKVVSLGLDVNTSGTHTIMIDQLENVDATTGIYLQDMQTGAMHNLRTSGYSFQAQAGSITNRFYVHFQPMVTSVVTTTQSKPTMVMSGDVLRINGLNEGTVVEGIQVLDMSGRRVISVSGMSESGQVERRVELPLGVYLIEVQTNRGVFTEKVFKSVR